MNAKIETEWTWPPWAKRDKSIISSCNKSWIEVSVSPFLGDATNKTTQHDNYVKATEWNYVRLLPISRPNHTQINRITRWLDSRWSTTSYHPLLATSAFTKFNRINGVGRRDEEDDTDDYGANNGISTTTTFYVQSRLGEYEKDVTQQLVLRFALAVVSYQTTTIRRRETTTHHPPTVRLFLFSEPLSFCWTIVFFFIHPLSLTPNAHLIQLQRGNQIKFSKFNLGFVRHVPFSYTHIPINFYINAVTHYKRHPPSNLLTAGLTECWAWGGFPLEVTTCA